MKRVFAVLVLLVVLSGLPAAAQQPYYAGKTIEIIVPFAPGGGSDIDARFFAPFFEKYIPGNPRVVIRNMPGGGGILATNFFAENARADGTQLLVTSGSTIVPYILGVPQVRYDPTQWELIKVNGVGGIVYVSPRTGIRRPADLARPAERLVYGGISATGLDLVVLLLFEVLGLDVRVVMGFEGRGPARLAFERGETNIDYQTTPAYLSQVVPLVQQGKAIPVMSMGFVNEKGVMVRDPSAPDLPSAYEVYQVLFGRKPDGLMRWKAYQSMVAAGFTFQKALWAPGGTPPEALQALRGAVDRMRQDPQFQEQAKRVLEGYEVLRGDLAKAAVLRATRVTLDVKRFITELLRNKYQVRL